MEIKNNDNVLIIQALEISEIKTINTVIRHHNYCQFLSKNRIPLQIKEIVMNIRDLSKLLIFWGKLTMSPKEYDLYDRISNRFYVMKQKGNKDICKL